MLQSRNTKHKMPRILNLVIILICSQVFSALFSSSPMAETATLATSVSKTGVTETETIFEQAAANTSFNLPSTAQQNTKSHAFSLRGEPKYGIDFSQFDYTSKAATKGGSMRTWNIGTYDSLNDFISKGNAASRLSLTYDTLAVTSLDEPSTYYGLIAKWIELPPDRSWIKFHIHPDAVFHDGKPITAEDVVFTFNLLIKEGMPGFRQYYADIGKATAEPGNIAKFTFKNLENKELPLIIGQLPVLPKHYWAQRDFTASSLEIPPGSGPYKIGKVDPGRRIVYDRVKDYWAKDHPTRKGMYNFDHLSVDYYKDFNIALEALKAGEYDVKVENVSKLWNTAYTGRAITSGQLKKQMFPDHTPQPMQAFVFNLRNPIFQNQTLRRALSLAFDFEWTNQQFFFNAYKRTSSYFTNSELAARGLPQGRELEILQQYRDLLDPSVFSQVFANPVTDGSGRDRANLVKAKKMLDAAGYKVVDGKLLDPKTQQAIEFEFLEYSDSFEKVVNPMIRALKRLGIFMSIRRVDTSQYINRLVNRDFDCIVGSIPASNSPGNELRDYWHSSSADLKGSRNYMGLKNPAVDKLVELVINAPNREELVFRTRALDRVLLSQHLLIPQFYFSAHRVAYWDKFQMPKVLPKYDSNFEASFMTWWYDPNKAAKIN